MTQNSSQITVSSTTNDVPPFPHLAAPVPPLEPAERQYAERPPSVPKWQPEDGDFN